VTLIVVPYIDGSERPQWCVLDPPHHDDPYGEGTVVSVHTSEQQAKTVAAAANMLCEWLKPERT